MVNIVSACCQGSIEQGSMKEYPLGGSAWYESYKIDVCADCGEEAEPVHTCGYCGAELNGDNPEIRVDDDERCNFCVEEVSVVCAQ